VSYDTKLVCRVNTALTSVLCFQGGGEVQEQRAGDEQPEAAPLPHSVGKVQVPISSYEQGCQIFLGTIFPNG
jgi:hypothetical protein